MPQSKNMARLSEDMKRELIAIIGGMKDPRVQGFLTVMRVEVAPDLSTAKVHVSKMGEENATAEAVGALNRAAGHVRSEIAKRIDASSSSIARAACGRGGARAAPEELSDMKSEKPKPE